MSKVELISNDEVKFLVAKEVAIQSSFIKDMLEECDEEATVPLPNVDGKTLKKVVEYMEKYVTEKSKEIEKPLKGKIEDIVSEWDAEFLNMEQSSLMEVIMAANYLNVKDLLEICCAKVASTIRGKKPEEIREMFGIENDFTPEEEAKIREENKWIEEC